MEETQICTATPEDIPGILHLEQRVWGERGATSDMLHPRIALYSQGNIITKIGGRIVGYVSVFPTQQEKLKQWESWYDITNNGTTIDRCSPRADVLFGVNLTVDLHCTQRKIFTRLTDAIIMLAIENHYKGVYLGSRLPFYHKYSHLDVKQYVYSFRANGKRFDPEIRLYEKIGLKIVTIYPNYFQDEASLNYGVLMFGATPVLPNAL